MTVRLTTMMLAVGSSARRSRTVSRRDIELFTELTGDRNPLHYDEELAARTRFGALIVHGGVTSGLLNAVVAGSVRRSPTAMAPVVLDGDAHVYREPVERSPATPTQGR